MNVRWPCECLQLFCCSGGRCLYLFEDDITLYVYVVRWRGLHWLWKLINVANKWFSMLSFHFIETGINTFKNYDKMENWVNKFSAQTLRILNILLISYWWNLSHWGFYSAFYAELICTLRQWLKDYPPVFFFIWTWELNFN